MKRIFCLLLAAILVFAAASCGESVNMSVLTGYQNENFRAELNIRTGAASYKAELEKKGERLFLSVTEPRELAAFTFVLCREGVLLAADGEEIPVYDGGLLRLAKIYPLFFVSVAGTWKIEKARPGGVELYVCENGSVCLYIDANSRQPLKLVCGETEVDVLSFTKHTN